MDVFDIIHLYKKLMKKRILLLIIILVATLLVGCDEELNEKIKEKKEEIPVEINIKRTGDMISRMYDMSVIIDDEEVFKVKVDKTEIVKIIMLEGVHTIQTKSKGKKSKKIEFEVVKNADNKFFFITEHDFLWGNTKLEKRKYLPIN